MLYPTLAEQFARRQRDWKPNMNIQQTPPYRVDPVLTGEYVPPNELNEHEMQCFDLRAWQLVVHEDASDCP